MIRKTSRVARQVREAKIQSAELEKKIRQLSQQISNPEKSFSSPRDPKSQSTIERFRKYFQLEEVGSITKRKPTRAELRAQKNLTIFWTVLAFFLLIWLINMLRRL